MYIKIVSGLFAFLMKNYVLCWCKFLCVLISHCSAVSVKNSVITFSWNVTLLKNYLQLISKISFATLFEPKSKSLSTLGILCLVNETSLSAIVGTCFRMLQWQKKVDIVCGMVSVAGMNPRVLQRTAYTMELLNPLRNQKLSSFCSLFARNMLKVCEHLCRIK